MYNLIDMVQCLCVNGIEIDIKHAIDMKMFCQLSFLIDSICHMNDFS